MVTISLIKTNFIFSKRVAVVLNGCGHFDGNDVLETASFGIQLAKEKATVTYFASLDEIPNSVIYTNKKIDKGEERFSHKESARLVRAPIQNLSSLRVSDFDGLIIPGGEGALKNLSDFMVEPDEFNVNRHIEKIVKQFWSDKKTIVASSEAVLLVAKILGSKMSGPGVVVTFGSNDEPLAKVCRDWGSDTAAITVGADFHVDEKNKIVSAPLNYWEGIHVNDLFAVVGSMVKKI